MPERQDRSEGVRRHERGTVGAACSRRRILQLSGTTVAAVASTSTVTADGPLPDPTAGEVTDVAIDDGDDRDPLGGGEGYSRTVHPEEADVVVRSREGLGEALTSAAGGDVVYVAGDASIDLRDATFTVPPGVTLASDRGVDGADGGHLYTDAETTVLTVRDDARVTGLRVQGPFYEYFDPDWYATGTGLRVVESGVEVDNCEVWGFAYAAVNARADAHVHHSHLHHNARDGLGYGVVTGEDHPLVEWNYFDHNRHSVAATGSHHGYTVRYNHFDTEAAGIVLDVHRPGGVRFAVHNNIVQPVDDLSGEQDPLQGVQVRGVPDERYEIYDNWFYNPRPPRERPSGEWTNEAIVQPTETAWRNVEFRDNYYGEDADVDSEDIIPGYEN